MNIRSCGLLIPLLFLAPAVCSTAQDVGRVTPASLPLPLPSTSPVPPNVLRARNPWILTMNGTWRFALTHGHVSSDRQYVDDQLGVGGILASSNETRNPPQNAFDGSVATRWCADGDAFPEWLQADLTKVRRIAGIALTWERPNESYRFRIEGGADGRHWKTLAEVTDGQGGADGPVTMTPADVRFVRITVTGNGGSGWASIRECQINIAEGGKTVAWAPPVAKVPSAANRDAFAALGYNDATWNNLAVPSNWEIAGYSMPTYNSVDNTVGMYRRWVSVPAAWAGRQIHWHFDGALDGAEIFINGRRAGYHESGYTAWNIDLTGLVHPGKRNLFAVRVSKTTPSVDCETGDFQAMGGIYRETFLVAVPRVHIEEATIRTPLSPDYRDATLNAQLLIAGKRGEMVGISARMYGTDGKPTAIGMHAHGRIGSEGRAALALSAPVKSPEFWSAEKPNLYYVVFELTNGGRTMERVEQRFGFKQIEIKNSIVLWNGRPIKCTGTCRHDFWADKGYALTDKEWSRDLSLMKAANINAIRTSHYNHAGRFMELCEEKGVYILDEIPYCWIGDQVKDPAYAPFLLQRARETLARDVNRPCVLAWSIGNENPFGPDSQQVLAMVKKLDPTRPAFVSQMNPNIAKGQDWADGHYPSPGNVDWDASHGASSWPENYSEHPHIFYQKETQDYDPGASDLWSEALIKTWDKIWKAPTILGSFIWEWQNQGIADKFPNRTREFWYGPDHLRQENNKGIVDAFRNPKPEWWIVKSVYSPVAIAARKVSPSNGTAVVEITNHYSFTDLNELNCRWTARNVSSTIRNGMVHIACPPGGSVRAAFPAPSGMTTLRLEFNRRDGSAVVAVNLSVAGVAPPAPPAAMQANDALSIRDDGNKLAVGGNLQEIVFDKRTGSILYWRIHGKNMLTGVPVLNLGEAKAGNERGFYHAPQPPIVSEAQVTAEQEAGGGVRVSTTGTVVKTAGGSTLGEFVCTYDVRPDGDIKVNWKLDWSATATNLWEAGLKFSAPSALQKMTWLRNSYFTDYPVGHIGEPTGVARAGETLFRATKRGLHWLALTDGTGAGVALIADESPLAGRAHVEPEEITLFASREIAGPRDFSGSWVSDHDIRLERGKPLTGSFILRAIAP